MVSFCIRCENNLLEGKAEALAQAWSIPFEREDVGMEPSQQWVISVTGVGLKLYCASRPKTFLYLDFTSDILRRRCFQKTGKEHLAQAVGIKKNNFPVVLDATAGFASDAFLLAAWGCRVKMIERSLLIKNFVEEALGRASHHKDIKPITDRMSLHQGDAMACMESLLPAEVIYLDPMFPRAGDTAASKKNLQFLQTILGETAEEPLLTQALSLPVKRVVVKRPRLAPFLEGKAPHWQLKGSSCRFDIYNLLPSAGWEKVARSAG